jgi:hypothetical protein
MGAKSLFHQLAISSTHKFVDFCCIRNSTAFWFLLKIDEVVVIDEYAKGFDCCAYPLIPTALNANLHLFDQLSFGQMPPIH